MIRISTIGIAVGLLGLIACSKSDDKTAQKVMKGGVGALTELPKNTITGEPVEALAKGKDVGWGDVVKELPETPTAPTGPVPTRDDLSGVSTAGITKPISGFTAVKQTGFRVAYAPTEHYAPVQQAFQQAQIFETIATNLNRTIKLDRVVDIQMVECGTVNAFYDPNVGRIIICYELIGYYVDMFKPPVTQNNEQLSAAIQGATEFAFFHELGHGLIDLLELPAVGREEDAVDQMATLILMESGDEGVAAAMTGAKWFALESAKKQQEGNSMAFWDEHSLDQQRFFNITCLVFGSNPQKYAAMVQNGYLPEARAMRCPDEYRKISSSWETLLASHLVNAAGPNTGPVVATGGQPTGGQPTGGQPTGGQPTGDQSPGWGGAPNGPTGQPGWGSEQPGLAANSCEMVSQHVGELLIAAFQQQVTNLPPEQQQTAQQQMASQLPTFLQQVLSTCQQQGWSDTVRTCVVQARDLQSADKCGAQ